MAEGRGRYKIDKLYESKSIKSHGVNKHMTTKFPSAGE
jgi:hypothetical protein